MICNVSPRSPHSLSMFCLTGLQDLRRRARDRQSRAFAPGTDKNHLSNFRLFLSFTVFYSLQALPATLSTLLLFIEFLTLSYRAPKAVANALSSVKFHHELQGFSLEVFHHVKLRLALRSLPRTMRLAPRPAARFPTHLLHPLVGAAAGLGVWGLPFRALCLLAFYTFARLSSLVPVEGANTDPSRWPTLQDLVFDAEGGGGVFASGLSTQRHGRLQMGVF